MNHAIFLLSAPLLLLAACGEAEKPAAPEAATTATATATATAEADTVTEAKMVLKADSKTGEIAFDLPGGTGASLRLPPEVAARIGAESKVDIDGVGMFPGASVTEIAAVERKHQGRKEANVDIGFTAPATPDAVAQWYVAAFREKGHSVERQGNRLSGTTADGDAFTLELAPEGEATRGKLSLREAKG